MKTLTLLCFLTTPLFSQLSYGILGGVPFTNLINGSSTNIVTIADKSGQYTVGPTIQFGLPLGFRVEADALYRPAGIDVSGQNVYSGIVVPGQNPSSAQWRFPILLQYRFSAPVVKLFVEAGYSYDHINVSPAISVPSTVNISPTTSNAFSITSQNGFVMGGGVDFKVPFVRISPELRYTRDIGSSSALNANQVEFLVGVRF